MDQIEAKKQIDSIMTQIEEFDKKIEELQKRRDYHMRRYQAVLIEAGK